MRNTSILLTAGALGGLGAVLYRKRQALGPGRTMLFSADRAKFKQMMPGVGIALIHGNPERGAYKAFTRFDPGYRVGVHTHSHDIWILVLRGAYVFCPEGGTEQRVEAGSGVLMPAGLRHWSAADPRDGALFFQESSGAFDLNLVEAEGAAAFH